MRPGEQADGERYFQLSPFRPPRIYRYVYSWPIAVNKAWKRIRASDDGPTLGDDKRDLWIKYDGRTYRDPHSGLSDRAIRYTQSSLDG